MEDCREGLAGSVGGEPYLSNGSARPPWPPAATVAFMKPARRLVALAAVIALLAVAGPASPARPRGEIAYVGNGNI
jgi:hypothetical protein